MSPLTKTTRKQIVIALTVARELQSAGVTLKGAPLAYTMGPHWHDLVWINEASGMHPYYSPSHTIAEVKAKARVWIPKR